MSITFLDGFNIGKVLLRKKNPKFLTFNEQ